MTTYGTILFSQVFFGGKEFWRLSELLRKFNSCHILFSLFQASNLNCSAGNFILDISLIASMFGKMIVNTYILYNE